jgi:allantoinase
MSLEPHFLQYPYRGHNMDHQRYPWRNLFAAKFSKLPSNAQLAVMVTMPLEFFALAPNDKTFKAPGAMETHYPDFRHYTTRDYGNRVGVYRLLKLFEQFGIKANVPINSELAQRYPILLKHIQAAGHEFWAHGVAMDKLHYGNMSMEEETNLVNESIDVLRQLTRQDVLGWLSPAYSESFNTPDLVAAAGCKYIGCWSNDDMPYHMHTTHGNLIALPLSQEISDRQIIINYHQTEDEFVQQVIDQFNVLYKEAALYGGRILSLTLTPYISGLPYRINSVEKIFEYFKSFNGVVFCTGQELAGWCNNEL